MKRILLALTVTALASIGFASSWGDEAHASTSGLQINPLQYEDTLTPGRIKSGHVDVSNPGDGTVHIASGVQGFNQTGKDGDLSFFTDDDLAKAIRVDLTDFNLGPREAVRVGFTVDPSKLPDGSAYAAIFFRTLPLDQSNAQNSYITESARVGTLLMLTRDGQGLHKGFIMPKVPLLQFDYGVYGGLEYRNTNPPHGVGFRPNLTLKVLPWGNATKIDTGLVLPGSTRRFGFARTASYFGFLPVIITDQDTHMSVYAWAILCTGWYAAALTFLVALLIVFAVSRAMRRQPIIPEFLRGH